MNHCDIAIIGGGMVGASLALAVAQTCPELRILVIEAATLPATTGEDFQPSFDHRSTAIAWGTRVIYEQLGVWPEMAKFATPIKHIHVSEKGRFGVTRLEAEAQNVAALGYVVSNGWMGSVLLQAARQTPSVQWLCPAEVKQVMARQQGYCITAERDGEAQQWQAGLTVLADGGRSGLRESLGIHVVKTDYRQHAVIANVETEQSHGFMAFERFTPDGPLAVLPLGDKQKAAHQSAIVMTVAESDVAQVMALDEADFCRLLEQRLGRRLGRFIRAGQRFHYPLQLQLADEQIRPGLAVIGNAAHALHPVAGQGYNLALRDVVALCEAIRQSASRPRAERFQALQAYLDRQSFDQHKTVGFSDSVTKLFGREERPLGILRDLGLMGMDLLPGFKSAFARQAMGLGGRAARLAD